MGGRGQRPSVPSTPGRGGRSAKFQKGALGVAVPKTLKEAIGAKGKPISVKDAYTGANPYYDPSGTYAEYTQNCQRSVVAYELRRRGYNVTAMPTFDGDILPYRTAGGNGHWMGAFQGAKSVDVSATRNRQVRSNIESAMKGFGPGSRGIIRVTWQGGNSGHVFNVENVRGSIRYVDAQTGKAVDIKKYLRASRPSQTRLVRTDNLRISERAKKSVTKAR